MKIKPEIIKILATSVVEGNTLRLTEQLDRDTYQQVNKVLKAIGGKWNSSKKVHIFTDDVEGIIQDIILTGEYTDAKKEYQFFPTPKELAQQLVHFACIRQGDRCLEPSAGRGNIAEFLPDCDCIELNPENRKHLEDSGFRLVGDDFLAFMPEHDYDVIVMNPPFCRQQDIKHITKAIEIAKRTVVAVASASVIWRTDKATTEFRDLVESYGGVIEKIPEKAFAESGTNVNTCMIVIHKERKI